MFLSGNLFIQILGILVGLGFFMVGMRLAFFPRNFIKGMMNVKYKSTAEPQKKAIIVTIIMGVLLMLAGTYYVLISVLSIIYPE
jgi:hypothetical protein